MHPILERLSGSDRRSIGEADQVAEEISADPGLFQFVMEALVCDDPVIRMRAADAVEKSTRSHPELLEPYKRHLLDDVAVVDQQEVRWHLAQLLPRLTLEDSEREEARILLESFLEEQSKIVRVNAMQALADLAAGDEALRRRVVHLIRRQVGSGSPAVRARGRRLLDTLDAHAAD